MLPAVALQAGLRDATAPWFHVNDSTYQIELAGEIVLDGETPYGRDYSRTGLERFYSLDGSVTDETRERQVALRHFAYFPGTALLGAAWRVLPSPWDDFRFLVALSTLGLLAAALAIPGPLGTALARRGRSGQPDHDPRRMVRDCRRARAPPASARVRARCQAKGRLGRRTARRGGTRQAVRARRGAVHRSHTPDPARTSRHAAGRNELYGRSRGGVPALRDRRPGSCGPTPSNTAPTYRIVGYGLSAILLQLGVLEDREGPYPFTLFLLLVWIPATVLLVRASMRAKTNWVAAAGFAVSMYLLLFLGRVFQISYLAWPLLGVLIAGYFAVAAPTRRT